MFRIYPFEAVRPRPEKAAVVASVPYDVVSREEARALGRANADSFIHVVRSDADVPDDVDQYDGRVYDLAKSNFERLMREKAVVRDASPRLYLYRQEATIGGRFHRQTGVACCVHVDDYDNGVIMKHEKTRRDKEDDRTRHILTVNAHTGIVFLAHRPRPEIDRLVGDATKGAPLFDFVAGDGVRHVVWAVEDAAPFMDAFAAFDGVYVADGHHRCASASRAAAERRKANPGHTGEEEYNRFLVTIFPADQLNILPYNRVVTDLNGLSPAAFLGRLQGVCAVSPTNDPHPNRPGTFCMYLDGAWRECEFPHGTIDRDDPISSLDVSLLTDRVLGPILGVGDVRTDKRIDFVGGVRGAAELKRLVDSGKAAAAFSMFPTTMEQLLAVSDAGLIMPPKSTWFEPKLRDGLLVHMLD